MHRRGRGVPHGVLPRAHGDPDVLRPRGPNGREPRARVAAGDVAAARDPRGRRRRGRAARTSPEGSDSRCLEPVAGHAAARTAAWPVAALAAIATVIVARGARRSRWWIYGSRPRRPRCPPRAARAVPRPRPSTAGTSTAPTTSCSSSPPRRWRGLIGVRGRRARSIDGAVNAIGGRVKRASTAGRRRADGVRPHVRVRVVPRRGRAARVRGGAAVNGRLLTVHDLPAARRRPRSSCSRAGSVSDAGHAWIGARHHARHVRGVARGRSRRFDRERRRIPVGRAGLVGRVASGCSTSSGSTGSACGSSC